MDLLKENEMTMDMLVKWGEKLLGMVGILFSMEEGEDFDEKLASLKIKVERCYLQFRKKGYYYADLYKKSNFTSTHALDKHEDCHIWMNSLQTLLQRLKKMS